MSFSRAEIISEALVRLGEAPVASESDRRASLLGVSSLYDRAKLALLAEHDWNFARWTKKLDQYVLTPNDPDFTHAFQYAFKLPADCVSVRGLASGYDYSISGGRLLWADEPDPILVYTREMPDVELPVWFVEALISKLVVYLCLPVTGDNSRLQVLEEQLSREIMRAAAKDDEQAPVEGIDMMRVYHERLPSRFE